jgi:hypothetical protein
VRLVADDDRVGLGDVAGVADEPLVGLDRDGPVGGVLAAQQRGCHALGVATVLQLPVELVDEVATVGQDEDPAGARGVHEAHCGDGLAGAGRVLEPEPLVGVGIVGRLVELVLVERRDLGVVVGLGLVLGLVLVTDVDLDVERLEVLGIVAVLVVDVVLDDRDRLGLGLGVVLVVVDGEHGRRRRGGRGAVALRLGQQRRQRARQRVHLVGVQRRAVGELGLVLGEDALEAEHEGVVPSPFRRRLLGARVDLLQRGVERAPASRARADRVLDGLAGVHEGFARELLSACDVLGWGNGRGHDGHWRGISQDRLPART